MADDMADEPARPSQFFQRVAWLEPLLVGCLALNALAASLSVSRHRSILTMMVVALGALAIIQLIRPTIDRRLIWCRAGATLAVSLAFMYETGGTSSPFVIGLVVAAMAYPFLLGAPDGFVVSALAMSGYAALLFEKHGTVSAATVMTGCGLFAAISVATYTLRRVYLADLSRLSESYRRLSEQVRYERAVLEALPHPSAIIGADGVIHSTNESWSRLCSEAGVSDGGNMTLVRWAELTLGSQRDAIGQIRRAVVASAVGEPVGIEVDVRLGEFDEDDWMWHHLSLVPLAAAPGGAMVSLVDVSAQVQNEHMADRLRHDGLTGLPNRQFFLEELRRSGHPSRRALDHMAVLFIDLDRFKEVNDTLGHDIGDALLIAAGERMRRALRPDDLLARLAGDEFVALCREVPTADRAESLAARLVEAIERPFELKGHAVSVSASIGVSLVRRWPRDPMDLVRQADQAMYEAKRAGRGRGVVYSEVDLREPRILR